MIVLPAMTRREMLRCIAAALVPLHLPIEATPPPCVENIDALFSSVESAAHVGRAFLALHPEERNRARLEELTAVALAARDAHGWRAWLTHRRRAELRDEQVVEIDGWVLALSEVRLCALVVVQSDLD
jgi:hypothetical protein